MSLNKVNFIRKGGALNIILLSIKIKNIHSSGGTASWFSNGAKMVRIAGILSVTIFFIFSVQLSQGAPCYGPNMPQKGKWDVGVQTNILLEREMEKKYEYGDVKSEQYFLTGSFGVTDWFSLDGKIGAGDVKHKPGVGDEINYDTNFAGAYGFRTRVFQSQNNNVNAILGFQHISVHPDDQTVNNEKNEIILDDWQLSALVSKRLNNFVPYFGTKVSRLDLIHKIDGERKRKKCEDNFGLVIGSDIFIKEKLRLNLEGRFIDEEAITAGLVTEF